MRFEFKPHADLTLSEYIFFVLWGLGITKYPPKCLWGFQGVEPETKPECWSWNLDIFYGAGARVEILIPGFSSRHLLHFCTIYDSSEPNLQFFIVKNIFGNFNWNWLFCRLIQQITWLLDHKLLSSQSYCEADYVNILSFGICKFVGNMSFSFNPD